MRSFFQGLSPGLKQQLKNMGERIGFDIRPIGINSRFELRLVNFLKSHGIDIVLDVGANRGQFTTSIFDASFSGRVVSFEPLPGPHSELVERAASFGPQWRVAPRMALSNVEELARFNISKSDTSSSLLEPTPAFVEATTAVSVQDQIEVPTRRLDLVGSDFLDRGKSRPFLKLDVQGAEMNVLMGAGELLDDFIGVMAEVSLVELYHGQATMVELFHFLREHGFSAWDIRPGYRARADYRLLQVDAVFFRGVE